jgi:hypothetical protein
MLVSLQEDSTLQFDTYHTYLPQSDDAAADKHSPIFMDFGTRDHLEFDARNEKSEKTFMFSA